MSDYTAGDLAKAAYYAGFRGPEVAIAVAISLAENSSRTLRATHRNSDGSVDRGPWQINSVHNFSGNPYDLQTNADQAYAVYRSQGWAAWTVYNSGSYRMHYKVAQRAASNPANAVKTETGLSSVNGFIHANQFLAGKGVDGAKAVGGAVIDSATAVPNLVAHLLSPGFWKAVGIGALAFLFIGVGILVIVESNKTVRGATIEAGKAAAIA